MKPKRVPRNPSTQSKKLELSDLNDDVLFEILLHFVAIDWDGGPFTLLMVCRKWESILLSKPRLWAWILVDDSQAEWKERMEVAAHLSRGLPLQIRLRVPFVSDTPISHIVRRCKVLFVVSPQSYFDSPLERWELEMIVTYETLSWDKARFKEMSDDVMRFLVDVPTNAIKIFPGDRRRECFAHSAWEIYNQIISGNSAKTLSVAVHPFLITALIFKHPRAAKSSRIHFEIDEVWALLPTLPHLSHLELYDNFINMDRRTVLPRICLQSLLTLTIDCPMTHWLFFSFSHDLWLGLLTLLTSLDTPIIDAISLHGSVQRIKAAMMKATTRPSNLTLSISNFDEAEDEHVFAEDWVWQGVSRVTVNLTETPKSFSRLKMPDGLVSAIHSLLSLLPKRASKRFRGGSELDAIAQSFSHGIEDLDIFYTHSRSLDSNFKAENVTSLGVSTWVGVQYQSHHLYAQWLKSVEYIFFDDYDIFWNISAAECFAAYLFHVSEPALKSWDSHSAYIDESIHKDRLSIRRGNFSYLTTLLCTERVASELVRWFDTPCLHSITLVFLVEPLTLELLPKTLLECASRLKELKVFGTEDVPDWSGLFNFLNNFKTPQGGISTINLPGFPHPSILQLLVDAFRGASPVNTIYELLKKFQEKHKTEARNLCGDCFGSRFLCYDEERCQRFSAGHMVSITKDTLVRHYRDEMIQDDEKHADPGPWHQLLKMK